MLIRFILFFISFSLAKIVHAKEPRIHNLAPQFVQFWEIVKDKPLSEQIKEFDKTIYLSLPEFYDYKFKRWMEAGKTKEEGLQRKFSEYTNISQKFTEKTRSISDEVSLNLNTFLTRFPDFNTDFEIYIIHSLGEMDGGTRLINGKLYFIFGVDGIVKYHNAMSDVPFIHHELFHVYHWQFFKIEDKIWTSLWAEGLATYVSEVLNPGATYMDMLLDIPVDLVTKCQKDIDFLWTDLESLIDSTDEKAYEKYFLLSSKDPRVPIRAGYYLGYLIAKDLAQTYSLDELIKMDHIRLRQLIGDTLTKFTHKVHKSSVN